MIKSELVAQIAKEHPHLSRQDVERAVTEILQEIAGALAREERVELRGFGAFSIRWRDARTARNPRTGDPVPVPRKRIPYFKAGKELRERLNEGYEPVTEEGGEETRR